ncbi:PLD nuclease N-terminal domain-containing protein [Heyndrickxia sporothermodurans]
MQLQYGLNDLKAIDWSAILPIFLPIMLISFILIVTALVDLYRYRKIRENVILWTIIIIFLNTIGPILYFTIGRKGGRV